jgi:Tol biopolymer transport system component
MRKIGILVVLLNATFAMWSQSSMKTGNYELPRIPGATLLGSAYPPYRLLLTAADGTLTLQEWTSEYLAPSVSADGNIVASTRQIPGGSSRAFGRVVSTYSVKDSRWTDHPELKDVDAIAIDPDGSKLACVTRDPQVRASDLPHFRFRVLDLKTEKTSLVMESSNMPLSPSWSPDGRRLAFDMRPPDAPLSSEIRAIYIANLETGTISEIGLGMAPAWSPSGEWIAFVRYVPSSDPYQLTIFYHDRYYATTDYQISLMSTTGTHSRILMGFHSDVSLSQPVWSPDSQALLVNKLRDPDKGTLDIYILNVVTGRVSKRFKNVGPVYAWISQK